MKIYTKKITVSKFREMYKESEELALNEIIAENIINENSIYQSTFEFIDSKGQYGVSDVYKIKMYVRNK